MTLTLRGLRASTNPGTRQSHQSPGRQQTTDAEAAPVPPHRPPQQRDANDGALSMATRTRAAALASRAPRQTAAASLSPRPAPVRVG